MNGACCWALCVLLVVVRVMNLTAMVVLTVAMVLEKLWSRGEAVARAVGAAALALAVAVIWIPGIAPGMAVADPPAGTHSGTTHVQAVTGR